MRLASLGPLLAVAMFASEARAQTATPNPHGSFSGACAQCHLADSWRPTRIAKDFKHAPGRFPLDGAHRRVACTACHTRLDFAGVSTTCASCHRDAHQGAFGATCASCHSPRSFLDMAPMRQAHQATAFPLTGAHAIVDCRSCHSPRAPGQQVFVSMPSTCVSCHLQDYQKTNNPPHVAAGFPRDCVTCHAPSTWHAARFDHAGTQFPLTGAHRAVTCAGCHADGVYRGKPTACVSCHRKDYDATTNPNHAGAGFPTDCASCHGTTQWAGATFNHDAAFFPIYSGAHRGQWSSCATCHTNPTNYAVFDCLSCHTKARTDQQHSGRPGYVYASPNCYACHPKGRSE